MSEQRDPRPRRGARMPTVWTRRLQVLTVVCSVVFTVGTTLQNFVIIDTAVIEEMMRRAGGADPTGDAPGFTVGFRGVGSVYIVGNALGLLAWWSRAAWLFWTVLAVNVTQGLGWVMIPPEMWSVSLDRYGVPGVLPSAVTDGGAVILSVALIVSLLYFRSPWATRRELGSREPSVRSR